MRMLVCLLISLIATSTNALLAQDANPHALPPDWLLAPGAIPEPRIVKKFINASDGLVTERDNAGAGDGLSVRTGPMITGAGWIALGPGYRHQLLSGAAVIDASATVSWRLYRAAQARFVLPHLAHDRLTVGTQVMYQDLLQVNYFGLSDQSRKSDRSAYRYNDVDVLGFASVRPSRWLSIGGRIGWIPRPDLSTPTGRAVTVPNTQATFSEASAPGITKGSSFLHSDVSIAVDWRDHPGHPTRGGLYRSTFAGYSDRSATGHSFQRVELEAAQYVPLFTRQLILALRGWEVLSQTANGHTVPFYLMPSLGGQNTLRGYHDYRFHDNNMQAFNAELRWSLFTHIDAAIFADAGKVAARAHDLNFRRLRKSYGFGFRVHNWSSTLVRLDVGHSVEGWRVFLKLSDPLRRTDPTSTGSAVVPFVP